MSHIVSSFDEDFAGLNQTIARLGGLAEAQLNEVTDLLEARKLDGLRELIARDKELDKLEEQLNEQAITLIARRAPMAQDLRRVLVAIKVASALERVGDYAKNIAKRAQIIIPAQINGAPMASLIRMSNMVQQMLHQVMDAYMEMDDKLALDVYSRDVEVDQLHTSLFHSLVALLHEADDRTAAASHLLFVAKNIERVGDFATNIAEQIYFLVHGQLPSDDRQKADHSSDLGA
jgi:phosphate transport system protein